MPRQIRSERATYSLKMQSARTRLERTAARFGRPIALGLTLVIGAFAIVEFAVEWNGIWGSQFPGYDYGHYLDGVRRWLSTGSPYLPDEVAGPYAAYAPDAFLHPPTSLLLLAPFLVLPAILWWAIPIAILVGTIVAWRPASWTWPIMALCLAQPQGLAAIILGNTDIWVAALVATGLRYGWPGVLVVIKPSWGPLLLVGAWRRSWWITAIGLAAVSIPFGSLWIDWFHVVQHGPGDLRYSLADLPLVVIGGVAWLGRSRIQRTRRDPAAEDHGRPLPR